MTRDDAEKILEAAIVDPVLCEKLLRLIQCDKIGVMMYRRRLARKLREEGMRKRDVIDALMCRLSISERSAYRLLEDE